MVPRCSFHLNKVFMDVVTLLREGSNSTSLLLSAEVLLLASVSGLLSLPLYLMVEMNQSMVGKAVARCVGSVCMTAFDVSNKKKIDLVSDWTLPDSEFGSRSARSAESF